MRKQKVSFLFCENIAAKLPKTGIDCARCRLFSSPKMSFQRLFWTFEAFPQAAIKPKKVLLHINHKDKMKTKHTLILALALLLALNATAQEVLTLDSCRARALQANRGIKQSEMKVEETAALEKAALMQMFPKVSANGGYLWMQRSVNLLSDEQKDRLGHIGDRVTDDLGQALHSELDDLPLFGSAIADRLGNAVASSNLGPSLNATGEEIVQGLETDTRNMGMAAFTVTQPIYMGGKLIALHRTAQLANHLAGVELDKKQQETLVAVDEAYWQVVSVQHKKTVAEEYAALLDTLTEHVELLVSAEMATRGDLAKVKVKRNEAQMMLTKATHGLALSKMLLAERCGMPLDSEFTLNDELEMMSDEQPQAATRADLEEVYSRRAEMRMLSISDSIARQGVRVAASSLKPNIVATGGYLLSNPNVFDGFSNTWGGTWMAGVAVNIPIAHPAGFFALKAAKAKRREVAFQTEEAREMIALQVEKLRCELQQSYIHLEQARSNMEVAEENLRLADESFKSGMCSSSDLMAAQTAWMQAQGEVIDARIETAMNRVYLNQAMGR